MQKKYNAIFGKHACTAVLESDKREIYEILTANDENIKIIPKKYIAKIKKVSVKEIEKIARTDNGHQNILVKTSDYIFNNNINTILENIKDNEYSCIFILDEIQDPHNFGAIIRNAFGFEIDAIITTKHRSCPISLGVLRSSAGYSEKMNIIEANNIGHAISLLQKNNFWVISLDSHNINTNITLSEVIKKYKKCVFIFGSEGSGIRQQNKKLSDIVLKISTNENIESLNVSSISAIIGYEYFKMKIGK